MNNIKIKFYTLKYKNDIIIILVLIFTILFLKSILNFFLDFKVLLIMLILIWYFGYLEYIKINFYNKMKNFLKIRKKFYLSKLK